MPGSIQRRRAHSRRAHGVAHGGQVVQQERPRQTYKEKAAPRDGC